MLNIYREQNKGSIETPAANSVTGVLTKKKFKTDSELSYGLWYVTHRVFLYRLGVGLLVTLCALLVGYSVVRWVVYLAEIPQSAYIQKNLSTANNYNAFHAHFDAQSLVIDKTLLLQSGSNTYDAVSEIINPNPHFIAQFDYVFNTQTTNTPPMRAVLLPGQDSIFKTSGLSNAAGSPNIILRNLMWQRLDPHLYPAPIEYQSNRLRFTLSGFTFIPASISVDTVGGSSISFKVKNESAFGYVQPRFLVGLYNNESLVGVLPWQIESFPSQAEKDVDLRSFVPGLQVTSIKLFPSINVYDNSVYLSPGV